MATDHAILRTTRIGHKLMKIIRFMSILVAFFLPSQAPGKAKAPAAAMVSYADVADLATEAPIIAKARIASVKSVEIKGDTPSLATRSYHNITVRIDSLIRGEGGLAPRVSFLAVAGSQRPRSGTTVLLYARPGKLSNHIQLISLHALQPWSVELETVTRAITSEVLSANPAPAILAVGDAFHVPGTVEGESETQIFLKTSTGAPVSLSIVHRPAEATRWGVSLGEIVDDAAVPPARNTLLWYRLACGLPDTLPASSTRGLAVLDAEATRRDYRFVMESLGRCGRTL